MLLMYLCLLGIFLLQGQAETAKGGKKGEA